MVYREESRRKRREMREMEKRRTSQQTQWYAIGSRFGLNASREVRAIGRTVRMVWYVAVGEREHQPLCQEVTKARKERERRRMREVGHAHDP